MSTRRKRPSIPTTVAIQLCSEIRKNNLQQWEDLAARWCWDCSRKSPGDPALRGFSRRYGNRGCPLVNALYAQRFVSSLK